MQDEVFLNAIASQSVFVEVDEHDYGEAVTSAIHAEDGRVWKEVHFLNGDLAEEQ